MNICAKRDPDLANNATTYKFKTDVAGALEFISTDFYNKQNKSTIQRTANTSEIVITFTTQQTKQDIVAALAPLEFGALMCQTLAVEADYTGIPMIDCIGADGCHFCEDCE